LRSLSLKLQVSHKIIVDKVLERLTTFKKDYLRVGLAKSNSYSVS